jgi:hypothetical protein
MHSARFILRSIRTSVVFAVILSALRLAGTKPSPPLIGVLAVAVVSGVMFEAYRWQHRRPDERVERGQVVSTAVVIYAYNFLPFHRGV